MSPAAHAVIRRLDATRQKWWIFSLLATTVLAAAGSLGLLLLFMLCDALLRLPQAVLLAMFLVWLGATVVLGVIVFRRLGRGQRSLEATARRVEAEFPELGSDLINLVQLSEANGGQNPAFCLAAVNEAAARLGTRRFEEAAEQEPRWRRLLWCMQTPRDLVESLILLGVLVLGAVLCHLLIPGWGSAASRLLSPWRFVPAVGSVNIISVTPGDTNVLVGTSLQIAAEIENPAGKAWPASLFVTVEGEKESELPMSADQGHRRYTLTLPAIIKPLKYRLEIGDSQTPIYTVGLRQKPTVEAVEITYHYPLYLGRPDEKLNQRLADLQAPQYTVADLRIRAAGPVAKGYVELGGQQIAGRVEEGRFLFVQGIPLVKDATFTIHLFNDAGHSDPNPRVNRIRVLPDQPPRVELLKPPRQANAAVGQRVAVLVRASDDHGLGRVKLEMKVLDGDPAELVAPGGVSSTELATPVVSPSSVESPSTADSASSGQPPNGHLASAAPLADGRPPRTLEQWSDFEGVTLATRSYELLLSADLAQPGQTVLLRAVAWDRRSVAARGLELRPQEAVSPWHVVRLSDPVAEANQQLAKLESLRTAIWQILEKQLRARMLAAAILRSEQLAERRGLAGQVRSAQVEIQQAARGLAESLGADEGSERAEIKQVLARLASNEMIEAVRRGDRLVEFSTLEAFPPEVAELAAVQERIIAVLRKLLDVSRQVEDEVLAELGERRGGDLPDDVRRQLEEARQKLEEFLAQQKKVIEASERLAKKPVEDFTAEEEQLLREMAASQDDWSRFMNELNTDLSKLPEQDFANPSLLKELVEIQTELKMAEDALLKKTVDIAVPLEQLGYERAEEIRTNLEKWLPDTPDRERWSQEESLTDADKEAPMAELPGELEDLIGELMEEEEDLFDEMEDISSSAADSLDKGAGWDAADGPISNMSAKGVTGNRLPNTSEIGGRAGEGRSGKSSGEFVGEEAVGKGGRRTPSRLTPDPYVQGQVRDHSQDPTGGATGGGKESGQGGEGLEGPLPQSPGQRELARLAGKQADLRNRAEGIELQFQIMNFHHTDLQRLIALMAQVERDLRAGRYENALRQRRVLAEGLRNIKQYVAGEFAIRQDSTVNLPAEIQKELLGSMADPSPPGWEELNRRYFERLAAEGAGTGP